MSEEAVTKAKAACLHELWKDKTTADLEVDTLAGGLSGAAVLKVKCAGSTPDVVVVKVLVLKPAAAEGAGEPKPTVGEAAAKVFGADQPPNNFAGQTWDSGQPGVQVMEFAAGTEVGFGHIYDNDEDPSSYGTCLARMHNRNTEWYDSAFEFKDTALIMVDPKLKETKVFEDYVATFQDSHERYGDLKAYHCCDAKMMVPGFLSLKEGMGSMVAGIVSWLGYMPSTADLKLAQPWFDKIAEELSGILDLVEETPTLMDRVVLNHGDCHGGQFIHRKTESGNLMMIDFDQIIYAPAWYDWGVPFFQYLFGIKGEKDEGKVGGMFKGTMPSLERRTLAAQAYLDSLGEETVGKYPGNTVEDVLFHCQKGFVGRLVFVGICCGVSCGLRPHPDYSAWMLLAFAKNASSLLKEARTDAALKADIVQRGIPDVTADTVVKKTGCKDWADFCAKWEADAVKTASMMSDLPLGPIASAGSDQGCGCHCM